MKAWPAEGISRIPHWIYTDAALYALEQERIFRGPSWSYVALEAEVPNPGDFKRSFIGDKSVVVVRDESGGVHVLENRCAHRGTQFCQQHLGNTGREFMCPYHQWTYSLKGDLLAVPFRRGVKRQGGMPADFDTAAHGLRKLDVTCRNGVVFASFQRNMEPFDRYLGENLLPFFDRVFDGRKLKVLGYQRQLTPANWKLMFENIKDPYHASLLHVFLVSFGLYRADAPQRTLIDSTGRHAAAVSSRAPQVRTDDNADMRSLIENLKLHAPEMLQPEREYPEHTIVLMTLWPNLIIQQQSNTLAMRQLVTRGPEAFELSWTFFGYESDDDAMTQRRIRQANLMGPSGYVSADDSEMMFFAHRGIRQSAEADGVVEMGGRDWVEDAPHSATESMIRAFYHQYRRVMEL